MTEAPVTTAGDGRQVLVQFQSVGGDLLAAPLNMPYNISTANLQRVCAALLDTAAADVDGEDCAPPPSFSFFVDDQLVVENLQHAIERIPSFNTEQVLTVVYQQEALFRVRAVTRCTGSMPGHSEAVVVTRFSPDGRCLASGSGDCTLRLWEPDTETPLHTCAGHKHWVLCIAWAPDGLRVASGCRAGEVRVWDAVSGQQSGVTLCGHRQWITQLCWQPLQQQVSAQCRLLASSSKDGDVRLWDTLMARCVHILSGHQLAVTALRWGGAGRIFTCSHDRTVRVWRPDNGTMERTLHGHAHWINTLALNTDYVLRVGRRDCRKYKEGDGDDTLAVARRDYEQMLAGCGGHERLVTGSDDFTMILWQPLTNSADGSTTNNKHIIARLTGHQQLINDVRFSPDGRLVASASFDKSIRLWNGVNGRFVAALRGHVQAVYMVSWAADSRLLVSASADSTLKVWSAQAAAAGGGSTKKKSLVFDLPGHADQVFAVDWSPDGERVASGGKDKLLRVWRR